VRSAAFSALSAAFSARSACIAASMVRGELTDSATEKVKRRLTRRPARRDSSSVLFTVCRLLPTSLDI
jgi:hypothetical protein